MSLFIDIEKNLSGKSDTYIMKIHEDHLAKYLRAAGINWCHIEIHFFYLLQLYLLTKQNSSKVNHRKQNLCYSSGKWSMDVTLIHSVHFSSQHSNNYCRHTSKSTFPFVCCYKLFVKFQNQSLCKKIICVCHLKINFSLCPYWNRLWVI